MILPYISNFCKDRIHPGGKELYFVAALFAGLHFKRIRIPGSVRSSAIFRDFKNRAVCQMNIAADLGSPPLLHQMVQRFLDTIKAHGLNISIREPKAHVFCIRKQFFSSSVQFVQIVVLQEPAMHIFDRVNNFCFQIFSPRLFNIIRTG